MIVLIASMVIQTLNWLECYVTEENMSDKVKPESKPGPAPQQPSPFADLPDPPPPPPPDPRVMPRAIKGYTPKQKNGSDGRQKDK